MFFDITILFCVRLCLLMLYIPTMLSILIYVNQLQNHDTHDDQDILNDRHNLLSMYCITIDNSNNHNYVGLVLCNSNNNSLYVTHSSAEYK